MTHRTYFKQFSRLSLHTLRRINHHNRRICRHQCSVSIFREILMPRRIKDINTVSIVIKLQYRRSNRNTSFFFYFHPV